MMLEIRECPDSEALQIDVVPSKAVAMSLAS